MKKIISERLKNQMALSGAMAAAVAAFAGWAFIANPANHKLSLLGRQITQEQKKITVAEEIIGLKRNLQGFYDKLSPTKDPSWLVGEVNGIADASHLSISSITPAGITEKGDYAKVTVRMELRGAFHDLGDFIARIESMDRLVKVCLLYTSPSPRDGLLSRMPSSA